MNAQAHPVKMVAVVEMLRIVSCVSASLVMQDYCVKLKLTNVDQDHVKME